MADELETTVREAALKLAKALKDASELRVQTIFLQTEDHGTLKFDDKGMVEFNYELPIARIARTIIQLDGDTEVIVPMKVNNEGELERDEVMLELHTLNVSSAIDYRASLLDALLSVIQGVRSR